MVIHDYNDTAIHDVTKNCGNDFFKTLRDVAATKRIYASSILTIEPYKNNIAELGFNGQGHNHQHRTPRTWP